MKLIQLGINKYKNGESSYTLDDINRFVRMGTQFSIEDEEGIDLTKDVLINIAFRKKGEMRDYLEYTINNNQLLELIESGGAENWLARKRRGF